MLLLTVLNFLCPSQISKDELSSLETWHLGEFSAYTSTCKGCSGITASGKTADYTKLYIAADLNYHKLGDKITLCLPKCKIYTVEDTGGAIKGHHTFDLLVSDYNTAITFGRRTLWYTKP